MSAARKSIHMRSLGGALLVCGALVAMTSGARATAAAASASGAAAPRVGAADALTPPTLTSATRQPSARTHRTTAPAH